MFGKYLLSSLWEIPYFSSAQFRCSVISDSLQLLDCSTPGFPVHHQLLEVTQTHVNWVSDAIQSFHPLSSTSPSAFNLSCIRVFPNSSSSSGGQSTGVSATASALPVNTQDWLPLGWTDWISLQSKGLSSISSNTTVQKHKFFGTQLSLWSNAHIHTWVLEKPYLWYRHDKVILYHGYSLKGSI